MVQCQTNPDGRCAMEPHCPPGECYLYAVAMKEHSDAINAVIDTLVPGARLAVDDNSGQPRVYLGRTRVWDRPRNLAASLRELADWLDGSR
jgi:hypothetical protein